MYLAISLIFIAGIIFIASLCVLIINSSSEKPIPLSEKSRTTLIITISIAVIFFYGAADLITFMGL